MTYPPSTSHFTAPGATSIAAAGSDNVAVVVAGHVDHGKSTIVGRLLADSGGVASDRLGRLVSPMAGAGREIDYSLLVDALREEREHSMTIETARAFLRLGNRRYLFYDAPGHDTFVQSLLSSASHADLAVLVVDVQVGLAPNALRQVFLLHLLGIRKLFVVINKMDLVGFAQDVFNRVAADWREVLHEFGMSVGVSRSQHPRDTATTLFAAARRCLA